MTERDERLLFDAVRDFAGVEPDRPAVIFDQRVTSYRQLDSNTNRVSNGLLALGLPPQSRVAILTGNNDFFFEVWHGAAQCNFVLAPINARLAPPEVAYIVNDGQAEVLFVDEPFHGLVEAIAAKLTSVREIIAFGQHGEWPVYTEWRDRQQSGESPRVATPGDTVVQMYTSGTTGFPKGVELSHVSVLACVRSMMGREAWGRGEIALVTAPLFHTAGSAWAHCALQSGGTIVLTPEPSPGAIVSAIERHRATQILLVPAVIRMVLQSPACAATDFSSVKRMLYGASPIPAARLKQAVDVFGCEFEQGYGLTETVGPVAMLRPKDHDGSGRMQSCGKAVAGSRIRVVDDSGEGRATGVVGEIIVSGKQLMTGYWNRPEDTAAAIRDGWLYTGDAGYFDADGFLYIHDRIKDMIVSGGENVYPAEVESALAGCAGVTDVAVIGVPDEKWGEAVKALVVAKPDETLSEQTIIEFARERIADFKCPKSVDFIDAIPRNPSGKILKRQLREPYWAGYERKIH